MRFVKSLGRGYGDSIELLEDDYFLVVSSTTVHVVDAELGTAKNGCCFDRNNIDTKIRPPAFKRCGVKVSLPKCWFSIFGLQYRGPSRRQSQKGEHDNSDDDCLELEPLISVEPSATTTLVTESKRLP